MLLSSCHVGSNKSKESTLATQYQLVVDADSSGSRVYLYKINHTNNLPIITDEFESSNNLGLASFAENPNNAGEKGMQPLLEVAIKKLYEINPNIKFKAFQTFKIQIL